MTTGSSRHANGTPVSIATMERPTESVWDYPRPPRLERTGRHLQVVQGGDVLADTRDGFRVLETSHPPVFYFPPRDVRRERLVPHPARSLCEWKGAASYFAFAEAPDVTVAWIYRGPVERFAPIDGYYAFYPSRVDACFIDGERVVAQEGDFYGGWITSEIEGPFKGGAGTLGW